MLAMADRKGRVWASIPGLANRARVPVDDCEAAIKRFLEPDKYSRTPDFDGRRVELIDGGWRLLNHEKYRQIRDDESIKESKRNYINRIRSAKTNGFNVENVEPCRSPSNAVDTMQRADSDSDSDAESDSEKQKKGRSVVTLPDDEWIASLGSDPAYKGVDVPREIAKCRVWCESNRKSFTRRRIVNWLNRCDRPVDSGSGKARFMIAEPAITMEEVQAMNRRREG